MRIQKMVYTIAAIVTLGSIAAPARGVCSPQELAKLIDTDTAAGDQFGVSVAISGDTVLVGANGDDGGAGFEQGSASVFVRTGATWTQQAKLTASDAAASDYFGYSVAIHGDTALVGAFHDDDAGLSSGSVYVFVRTGTIWTQQAKLTASDAASIDYFGYSVSVNGNTALIGAYTDDHAGGTDAGSAYVFVRSGTVWTQQAKLTASDAAMNDNFGISVSLIGDTALVGAYADDGAAGSAYVFVRSGTVWTQQAKLTASDAAGADFFGWSVAVSGNSALVGAYGDDHAGGADAGSAYVFVRSGTVWTQQAKLIASDAAAGDAFGASVSLAGDTALVGAIFDDDSGSSSGSAYAFVRSGATWMQQAKLTASDAAGSDQFGDSVSISGDTAVVGAYADDHAGGTDAGSAYVFDLGCCCRGDMNGDNVVNGLDIQLFVDKLLSGGACP